jgi:hypothetical protein
MLLACDEASTDNRWLELKRTRVSVSTQVYILPRTNWTIFLVLTEKKTFDSHMTHPLHELPFLCQRHGLTEKRKKTTKKTKDETRISKTRGGGRVMQ